MPETLLSVARLGELLSTYNTQEMLALRDIFSQAARVPNLLKIIRDHEEDCACLPEDRSVTETVNALGARVAELGRLLGEAVARGALPECACVACRRLVAEIKAALQDSSPASAN